MLYSVVFNVDEQKLLDMARDNGDLDLTPKSVFEKELGWLEQSGIQSIEVSEIKKN